MTVKKPHLCGNSRSFAILGAMAVTALAAAGFSSVSGIKANVNINAPVNEMHVFRVADGADGSVRIFDFDSGLLVRNLDPGTNGFLRATLRGLARQRHAQGIGAEQPFQIVRYVSGQVALIDPSTGAHVALDAFGQTNAAVFANLMKEKGS